MKKKAKAKNRKPTPKDAGRIIPTHTVTKHWVRPNHPITVDLIGVGGTGSHMLAKLAVIDYSLKALRHPGLQVRAWDPDKVTEHNVGRQSFLPSDIGFNKAAVLITRINRSYGLAWTSVPRSWVAGDSPQLIITCVDNVACRKLIQRKYHPSIRRMDDNLPDYWLDLGNGDHYGQAVLGTVNEIIQPAGLKGAVGHLPNIFEVFPDLETFDKPQAPSCSMAESLARQDLCINSMMANYGAKLIWMLLRDYRIEYHGVFVNLKTLTANPIRIKGTEQSATA